MKKLLLGLTVLLLAGCSTPTPYQPMGFLGGYSEIQLNQTIFRVSVEGNSDTFRSQVDAITLRRCAELTIQHGYKYFIIIDSDSQQHTSTYIISKTHSTTTGTSSRNSNAMTISFTNDYVSNALDANMILNQTAYLLKQ